MGKKLHSCSECGNTHRPKGSGKCPYVEAAKQACIEKGQSVADFAFHMDLDIMQADNESYLAEGSVPVKAEDLPSDVATPRGGHSLYDL